MKQNLKSLTDRGCWISQDRVYAFVSAEHGITEIGYHGLQPVSKNSRIFVRDVGVLTFTVQYDGMRSPLKTEDVDWQPERIESQTTFSNGICSLVIESAGRALLIRFTSRITRQGTVRVHLAKEAQFRLVHGERSWGQFRPDGGMVKTDFRDRIMLQEWIRRTGPYAGDFLIPEPIRRKIFSASKRSGLATPADLRPEFREKDIALYDAAVFVTFGGREWKLLETVDSWTFERILRTDEPTEFVVQFSDEENEVTKKRPSFERQNHRSQLKLPRFPRLQEFAAAVPGIVESCVVRDYGVPRACPGRYYWIWSWDSLVTMAEALRWGDRTNALKTAAFIEGHRDENGRIPSRWTRSLLPLDTPSPGGIEFLQASLVYEAYLETNDDIVLQQHLPALRHQFGTIEQQLLKDGLVRGEGFYPDLLSAFGRNETSAVCMEVGSWYTLCRILENIARHTGDVELERRAGAAAGNIGQRFDELFWDAAAGFFVDSINPDPAGKSRYHPLFALLFLQSPLGLKLLRRHIPQAAAFIEREFAAEFGIRVLPLKEASPTGEDVLDSWYPHWDLYALKLLRRSGRAEPILRWLAHAEEVLATLGYCPEFLALQGFREDMPKKWEQHGSASNVNCITSWHRSIRETIAGFEFDPGGITHLPHSLPIDSIRIDACAWRGGTWTLETLYDGPHFQGIAVDGTIIDGCTKVPLEYHSPGDHIVTARYGNAPMSPCFTELVNAKLRRSKRISKAVVVEVEPMGYVEVVVYSPLLPRVFVNDRETLVQWDRTTGIGTFSFSALTRCTVRMEEA